MTNVRFVLFTKTSVADRSRQMTTLVQYVELPFNQSQQEHVFEGQIKYESCVFYQAYLLFASGEITR